MHSTVQATAATRTKRRGYALYPPCCLTAVDHAARCDSIWPFGKGLMCFLGCIITALTGRAAIIAPFLACKGWYCPFLGWKYDNGTLVSLQRHRSVIARQQPFCRQNFAVDRGTDAVRRGGGVLGPVCWGRCAALTAPCNGPPRRAQANVLPEICPPSNDCFKTRAAVRIFCEKYLFNSYHTTTQQAYSS